VESTIPPPTGQHHPVNPHAAASRLLKISRLGLLVFEPKSFSYPGDQESIGSLSGPVSWVEVPRDDAAFLRFLGKVLDVLEQPTPPAAAQGCQWCNYRNQA
jgi:hypothetical protein